MCVLMISCSKQQQQTTTNEVGIEIQAQTFLTEYNNKFQKLETLVSNAAWLANTDIKKEHDEGLVKAEKQLAAYIGSSTVINNAKKFLKHESKLTAIQKRQLERILTKAARYPGTLPQVVDSLITAEAKQNSDLYGFEFSMTDKGKKIKLTANDIDKKLQKSKNLKERLKVWEASKEVGKNLKDGLANLQSLRNQVARHMGYSSFFGLEVSNFDMSSDEMVKLLEGFLRDIKPLYEELHTFARYELAKRYKQPVPELIPAHWIGNRWAQNWPGLVDGIDLDSVFKNKKATWLLEQAERFYMSLGFSKLPQSFWDKSDLYPAAENSTRKKNSHASAWHVDLKDDVRSLMSVEPNFQWFSTTHHELGHIYYYMTYSTPEIPYLLRRGANRGFHEGIGTLIELASNQPDYMNSLGLNIPNDEASQIKLLLDQAFNNIIFMPFGAGTMTHFEYDLYEKDLPKNEFNKRWWHYVKKYQGVEPPSPRSEEFTDAATKTHINNDPAQYYDYIYSQALLYTLHEIIAKDILKKDIHNANYYDSKEVGVFLQKILSKGATQPWDKVLKELTDKPISAKPMLNYYAPVMAYLKEANKGRKKTVFNW
ncbi:M2 family metallopeptidase [bacterium]|nr:M2 family metallopeptidase [bacterium]MBU1917472.1 M2 family metallopeptidase [bacterium]